MKIGACHPIRQAKEIDDCCQMFFFLFVAVGFVPIFKPAACVPRSTVKDYKIMMWVMAGLKKFLNCIRASPCVEVGSILLEDAGCSQGYAFGWSVNLVSQLIVVLPPFVPVT